MDWHVNIAQYLFFKIDRSGSSEFGNQAILKEVHGINVRVIFNLQAVLDVWAR